LNTFHHRNEYDAFVSLFEGGNKHTIPFRRQRLDIDEMLPESSLLQATYAQPLPYVNDPYIIDIVKVTEDRVAELELDLQQHRQHTDELETKLINLNYQARHTHRSNMFSK
jgi:centrosomal protein CEP135